MLETNRYQPNLYPFHHVEVDDYWTGISSGWRAIIAELIGTMIYTFAAAGVSIASNTFTNQFPWFEHTVLVVALGEGLAYTAIVFACFELSGGHINPATTWGALITRRIGILRGVAYMVAQCVGALLGALVASWSTPSAFHGRLGAHFWQENLSNFNGFLLQAMLTFFLVFVVFATYFDPLGPKKLAALPIGLTVVFSYLIGWVFVGPPMNPARVLGTAVIYGNYDHLWVYWAGPFTGATVASLLYLLLFMTRPIRLIEQRKVTLVPNETTSLIYPTNAGIPSV